MSNLNKTVKSSALLILESVSKKLVGLVSTLILARLLTPEDFGIVAIATLAFGLLEVFSYTGSGQYIHTSKTINDNILDTAFTYNLLLKSSIALIFACFIPFVVDYYDDERLYSVLLIFSLMLAIQGLENPQVNVLQREQNYGRIVKMIVIAKVISTLIAITIALLTKSYWALVGGQFVAYTLPVAGGYLVAPRKPKLTLVNIKDQFSYSGWLIPSSMMGYARGQIDTILVTRLFEAATLGSYHVMKYLCFIPSLHLVEPMTRPLLAQLSSIRDNKEYFAKMFNVSLLVTLAIALPISNMMFYYADVIIGLFLGKQWVEYSHMFSLFALLVTVNAITQHADRNFLIFSNTRMSFLFQLATVALMAVTLLSFNFETAYDFAFMKVSIEMGLSAAIITYVAIYYTSFKNYLRSISLVSIFVLISFVCLTFPEELYGYPNGFWELVLVGLIFMVSYVILLLGVVYSLKRYFDELDYIWSLFLSRGIWVVEKVWNRG